MTRAELERFCKNHGIPPEDAESGLRDIEELTEPPPKGVGLPKHSVGDLMEAAAYLHHVLRGEVLTTFGKAGAIFATVAVKEVVAIVRRFGPG